MKRYLSVVFALGMGMDTWAGFMGSERNAVVDGYLVCTVGELQGVLKARRTGGIQIVAIHNHRTTEEPHLIFPHEWGQGWESDLVGGLKGALGKRGRPARREGGDRVPSQAVRTSEFH